jgi:hypothetical protein
MPVMAATDQSRDHAVEKRKTARETVMFMGTISCANASFPVKLRNLSSDGAMFVGEVVSYAGAWLTLRRNDQTISGRMAWSAEGSGGVRFEDPVDTAGLHRALPTPRQIYPPRCRRPGLISGE